MHRRIALVLLPLLVLAPLALGARAQEPERALTCWDVRDLLLWDWTIFPEKRTVVTELQARGFSGTRLEVHDKGMLVALGTSEELARVQEEIGRIRARASAAQRARARQAIESHAKDYDELEHARTLVKLTWTGDQTKPVPGLAVHTTDQLFDLVPFRAFAHPDFSYGNDGLGVFGTCALTAREMDTLVRAVAKAKVAPTAAARDVRTAFQTDALWSLSVVDLGSAKRPNWLELFLTADEAQAILKSAAEIIRDTNPVAADVLANAVR